MGANALHHPMDRAWHASPGGVSGHGRHSEHQWPREDTQARRLSLQEPFLFAFLYFAVLRGLARRRCSVLRNHPCWARGPYRMPRDRARPCRIQTPSLPDYLFTPERTFLDANAERGGRCWSWGGIRGALEIQAAKVLPPPAYPKFTSTSGASIGCCKERTGWARGEEGLGLHPEALLDSQVPGHGR